jgi:polar amino acid transport system substrate-binding protein
VLYYIKDKPQYAIVARIPTGKRYSLMGWEMSDQVNDIISKMKEDGTFGKIHHNSGLWKWFRSSRCKWAL